ncbi:beta-mannosidase [Mycolicibacterium madagascariense]|uniref:Beta-mannosidase n=1 Tax=Mycolicibacterium madagascariense TaxID=212765 RepID=A0A7I7XHG4_9MYCO|nr:sugar-binding domain-containing protein [Mycolicibacterium madagascariense]MCV7011542.1 glycoside hydrolase [Mycolicibacterium madagascariense]BBZ28646.1 beta-mannosidase [Mycolicibacterium madagascariense]
MRQTAVLGLVVLLLLLSFSAGDVPTFARPEPAAQEVQLDTGWQLASAREVTAGGADISQATYRGPHWHTVKKMPSSVLQALEDDGTYPNLYYGKNLLQEVPQDLWKQDWWYRTTFVAPAGHTTYQLNFPGINYRAEIWLNGHRLADATQIVGMYVDHDLDVTPWIRPGGANTLAVKVTPERALQDVDGVELADSWFDWINWNYLGYQGPGKNPGNGNSFVADRNAGILKPVTLRMSGAVAISSATVNTELPLPKTDSARLSVFTTVRNFSARRVEGVLRATISRRGKADVRVEQRVGLAPGEQRDVGFSPDDFAQLTLAHPDLWWPYTMGAPDMYDLHLEFRQFGSAIDETHQRFGVRTITQARDDDERFPELGSGGSFYLQVNGRDFLVRGATYTPDLLYDYDLDRQRAILSYARDLGLNMLRLESKIPDESFAEAADELGIPLMVGWMCCNQWEKWPQWNAEDNRVARDSLRSQITMLRSHPSAFVWANGSDGRPPQQVRDDYHQILRDLHWQNAVVDTVSSYAIDASGQRLWDGIQMAGPYTWRPPTYWFSGRYRAARGASAEQGDNEHIPPFASLQEFIPPDKLWPINDYWTFHAGSNPGNSALASIQLAINRRYGPSSNAYDFARKAQLAHYESTRAQFESYAALGWAGHKMTIYWMLNSHWPSFFGNVFDYYLRPGGAYYGAKAGLRPLSAVFDSYATGDHGQATVTLVNQRPEAVAGARVRVRVYDLNGRVRDDRTSAPLNVPSGGTAAALVLPREARDSRVFFVRCEVLDAAGKVVDENVYWQSQRNDDVGNPNADFAFELRQESWADMTPLNTMPRAALDVSATRSLAADGNGAVTIHLHNPGGQVAFFERAEVTSTRDGDEILPMEYDDNYVTVFPGETVDVRASMPGRAVSADWVRVTGYNSPPVVVPVGPSAADPVK